MSTPKESSPPVDPPPPAAGSPPDNVEQDLGEQIDNIVPTRGYHMLPLVGLGGSAGSITALQAFFAAMPADSGLAFAVVIHLSREHESMLAEVLGRATRMRVRQAEDRMRPEPDCVYVIPPGRNLIVNHGHFRLKEMEREQGRRTVVDLFFRSLADAHGPHATAIVLSGVDGDGAIGIKRIKERGGLTIAQDPGEAEHAGMPAAAVATAMVDWVLKAAEMPARLLEYHRLGQRIELPPEEEPAPVHPPPRPADGETALQEVLAFLRARTGRDFSCYKRATVLRRISRRMQVNCVADLAGYLALLRTNPGETGALLKDLLISVTNFFRDRDAFAELESRLPGLFAGRNQGDALRIWVPACATGEEAYSIAMLLLEHARTLEFPPAIQVFGCDLDADAIQAARAGLYPAAITTDVSEARLQRFFIQEPAGYRVRRELREKVLFAVHDLLKDPPFSRMDLLSCRNLLIYLAPEAQRRALAIFHFSLRPGGLLFLGSSESTDDGTTLFSVVQKKHRLYAARPARRARPPPPPGPRPHARQVDEQTRLGRMAVLPGPAFAPSPDGGPPKPGAGPEGRRLAWSEVHYRLLERFAPPSLIVNADYDIQHLSEGAGRFLQLAGGEPKSNLLHLVHPMLRIELRALLFRAAQSGEMAQAFGVPMANGPERRAVNLRVYPVGSIAPDYLLVVFAESAAAPDDRPADPAPESVVQQLDRELQQMKGHLRETVEQYEAGNEELKASNEELQAMNEELRSATEELETSREELQSINEELTTVNSELKGKVDELAHANSDLQNLMASTAIAIVFLDRELRITRFTPPAVDIFHLIPGDIGRPLNDLRHRLDYPELRTDAAGVLGALMPVDREVAGPGGRSYLARLLPYRTTDDRIAGVVLTCVDITESKRTQETLNEHLEELTRFNRAAEGRELRMIELKKEINTLTARLGEPARYPLEFEADQAGPAGP